MPFFHPLFPAQILLQYFCHKDKYFVILKTESLSLYLNQTAFAKATAVKEKPIYMKTLTEARGNARLTKSKLNRLIIREYLMPEDVSGFSTAQREQIKTALIKKLKTCEPKEKHALVEKIAMVSNDPEIKKDIWEINHQKVVNAISAYLTEYGFLPTQTTLAKQTGLSRQSIATHLKTYHDQPAFADHLEQLQLMKITVLERVLAQAVSGDLKAAKIFMDTINKTEERPSSTTSNTIKQQNNYIQVNGLLISEEKLGQLSQEQLRQLETIFNSAGSPESPPGPAIRTGT